MREKEKPYHFKRLYACFWSGLSLTSSAVEVHAHYKSRRSLQKLYIRVKSSLRCTALQESLSFAYLLMSVYKGSKNRIGFYNPMNIIIFKVAFFKTKTKGYFVLFSFFFLFFRICSSSIFFYVTSFYSIYRICTGERKINASSPLSLRKSDSQEP